jgi:UDP-N-acetylmuramyl pentapeptide phosphotransferase/UDP-N-acetylglucosamine-1-phosphate transferase
MSYSIFKEFYLNGFAALLVSICLAFILYRTKKIHKSITSDNQCGPQKIHNEDIIRIGGLSIFLSLLINSFFVSDVINNNLFFLIIASTPAFLGGFIEDITKKINPFYRLLTSFISGIFFVIIFKISISHTNIYLLDFFLKNQIFSILFTIFCIVMLTQSMNIIDGLNGLSMGCALIICVSILFICIEVQDYLLILITSIIIGAIAGCLVFNFPKPYFFLGDGGAYLIGSLLAFLVILLSERNNLVSPFYCLLLVLYPVYETTRSFCRRLLIAQNMTFRPDHKHLHSLLFKFISKQKINKYANSFSSLLILIFQSLYAVIGFNFFSNKYYLILFIFLFIIIYELIYIYLKGSFQKT